LYVTYQAKDGKPKRKRAKKQEPEEEEEEEPKEEEEPEEEEVEEVVDDKKYCICNEVCRDGLYCILVLTNILLA